MAMLKVKSRFVSLQGIMNHKALKRRRGTKKGLYGKFLAISEAKTKAICRSFVNLCPLVTWWFSRLFE